MGGRKRKGPLPSKAPQATSSEHSSSDEHIDKCYIESTSAELEQHRPPTCAHPFLIEWEAAAAAFNNSQSLEQAYITDAAGTPSEMLVQTIIKANAVQFYQARQLITEADVRGLSEQEVIRFGRARGVALHGATLTLASACELRTRLRAFEAAEHMRLLPATPPSDIDIDIDIDSNGAMVADGPAPLGLQEQLCALQAQQTHLIEELHSVLQALRAMEQHKPASQPASQSASQPASPPAPTRAMGTQTQDPTQLREQPSKAAAPVLVDEAAQPAEAAPAQQRSFAAAAGLKAATCAQPSSVRPASQPPARHAHATWTVVRRAGRRYGLQHSAAERLQLRLHTPAGAFAGLRGRPLREAVQARLQIKLHMPDLVLKDVGILSSKTRDGHTVDRFLIFMEFLYVAEDMVSARHVLKGTDYSLHDVLTEDEQQAHDLLWPDFIEAQERGKLAQFNRARLHVDGVEILPRFPAT
jgi:hypothetical protein